MITKKYALLILCTTLPFTPALAKGDSVHHALRTQIGGGYTADGEGFGEWKSEGWIGTDTHKAFLAVAIEHENDSIETGEIALGYSQNIDAFWDARLGLWHDTKPDQSYLGLGFSGLAPYFFETEAYLLIGHDGDVGFRVHLANEFLITQRISLEPFLELSLFIEDILKSQVDANRSDVEFGVEVHYEFSRRFALYGAVKYEHALGSATQDHAGGTAIGVLGIKLLL